jgi:hypothetical protein
MPGTDKKGLSNQIGTNLHDRESDIEARSPFRTVVAMWAKSLIVSPLHFRKKKTSS